MAGIRICIDRGGTFTDCIAFIPNTIFPKGTAKPADKFRTIVVKLLSVDPNNYPGIMRTKSKMHHEKELEESLK
jgi:5-oxoprolinase (ATP-hydrolysing)